VLLAYRARVDIGHSRSIIASVSLEKQTFVQGRVGDEVFIGGQYGTGEVEIEFEPQVAPCVRAKCGTSQQVRKAPAARSSFR
jgi:hypothetical protein